MQRIPEPELMNEKEQAEAYAATDFSESHNAVVRLFQESFPAFPRDGTILELGCGTGDVTLRFARAFPQARFVAVDGAEAMLALARSSASAEPAIAGRIEWVCAYVPSDKIPARDYDAVVSNSLLHHLHDPSLLWRYVASVRSARTKIFTVDLVRPASVADANEIVERRAGGAPDILKRDFVNSLCAAFTVDEIRAQLDAAGLRDVAVQPFGEIYAAIRG